MYRAIQHVFKSTISNNRPTTTPNTAQNRQMCHVRGVPCRAVVGVQLQVGVVHLGMVGEGVQGPGRVQVQGPGRVHVQGQEQGPVPVP